jgi:hypothetical protein
MQLIYGWMKNLMTVEVVKMQIYRYA